jgi:chromate transporter
MSQSSDPVPPPRPSLWSLFSSFAIVSTFGFGGTLAWARRMAVDERRWMSAVEFNEVFALCQFLPGPNVVNFAVVFGEPAPEPPGYFRARCSLSCKTESATAPTTTSSSIT